MKKLNKNCIKLNEISKKVIKNNVKKKRNEYIYVYIFEKKKRFIYVKNLFHTFD